MSSQRILLIKSDEDTHRALRSRLEERGYDVFEAENEQEGVRMAWELEPDLLIQEDSAWSRDRARTLDDLVVTIETLIDAPVGHPA